MEKSSLSLETRRPERTARCSASKAENLRVAYADESGTLGDPLRRCMVRDGQAGFMNGRSQM